MVTPVGYVYRSLLDRFNDRFQVEADGCWRWMGSYRPNGYGQIYGGPTIRRMTYAHRIAYMLFKGPISPELVVDHLCRNRWCVNPAHLEAVDQRTNLLRGDHPNMKAARENRCRNGHTLTADTVYVAQRGKYAMRVCRECRRASDAKRHRARSSP